MIRTLFIVLVGFLPVLAQCQSLVEAEYFVDDDPGIGQAMPISVASGDSLDASFSIPTQNLSPGMHWVAIRVKDDSGRWTPLGGQMITISAKVESGIAAAEYVIDNDMGVGHGISLSLTPGDSAGLSLNIPGSNSPGTHWLTLRVQDSSGKWSVGGVQHFTVKDTSLSSIVKAEAFFDNDPGLGSATDISVSQGDSVGHLVAATTDSLQPGPHAYGLRVKNQHGAWSVLATGLVTVRPVWNAPLDYGEYFFNTDRGKTLGYELQGVTGDVDDRTITNPTDTLPYGMHFIYARVRDTADRWSQTIVDSFEVIDCDLISQVKFGFTSTCDGTIQFEDSTAILSGLHRDSLTYQWDIGNDGTVDTSAADFDYAVPMGTSNLSVRLVAFQTSETGCVDTAFAIVPVRFNKMDTLTPITTCPSDTALIFGQYVSQPGYYSENLTGANGCDSLVVQELKHYTAPPVPTAQQQNLTLYTTTSAVQYQWYLDGDAINGATDSVHTATDNGDYYVVITDSNGCAATSNIITVMGIGVVIPTAHGYLHLYPNPAREFLVAELDVPINEPLIFRSITGAVVRVTQPLQSTRMQMDISGLPKGVYLIGPADMNLGKPVRIVVQ